MKFNDELLTDIWNSPVKLNEWFFRDSNNNLYFIDVEQRNLTTGRISGNQYNSKTDGPIDVVDVSKLIDRLGFELPKSTEHIILFLNEIAQWFELRYVENKYK